MRMYEKHNGVCDKTESRLYKIGMFAAMNRITVKTLRFYEEQGLLFPAHVDGENGYRYYTMDQMETIHKITALKRAGFTLEEIKKLNVEEDEKAFLQKKKAALLEQIAELTRQMAVIDGFLSGEKATLQTPVLVKKLPAVLTAVTKRRIHSYDEMFSMMPQMGAEMERLGCECAIPEYCFTNYLESGYKEEDILVEACEAVTERKPDSERLYFKEFPEAEAACIFHKGSYDRFSESYAVLLRYIEENGYEISGEIRESYIDGVWNKEREEDWLSEIQIPVRKKEKESMYLH